MDNTPAVGQPAAAPAVPADAPPKVPGARKDVQARIDELSQQKAYFQQKAEKYAAEQRRQGEEIAALRAQIQARPAEPAKPAATPKTWDAMNDDQLENARVYARQNDQPDMLDAVHREFARREAEKAATAAASRATKDVERKLLLRDIQQQIIAEHGAEAFDPESPLYQGASRYLDEQRRLYGDEHASQPHRLADAFAHADRLINHKGRQQRLTELEQENQRLRDAMSLAEHGGIAPTNARPISDEVKEALKEGNTKKAARKLAITASLSQQVKNSLLPNRS